VPEKEENNPIKGSLNPNDPIVIDLVQRVTRLEERVSALEKIIGLIKEKLDRVDSSISSVDNKIWYVLATILISILIEIIRLLWVVAR